MPYGFLLLHFADCIRQNPVLRFHLFEHFLRTARIASPELFRQFRAHLVKTVKTKIQADTFLGMRRTECRLPVLLYQRILQILKACVVQKL